MPKIKPKKTNIHDDSFKHNFTNKRVAHDFLLYNLPKKVLDCIDIETVQIEPTDFLPSRYRSKRRADILYSVKSKRGKRLYALLHLEGQSSHDKYMALRVWEYHVAIVRAHLHQGYKKVPLILTFVLYHGKRTWTSAKSVAELFDNFDLYVDVSLKMPFLLNLTKRQIEELKKQGAASAPQLIMKGQAMGDFCDILDELWPHLERYEQNSEENMNYMATVDKHGGSQFIDKLIKFDPITANNYKVMFEQAIAKEVRKATAKEIRKEVRKATEKIKIETLKAGKIEGVKATIAVLLKQGAITQEQADKTLQGLKQM